MDDNSIVDLYWQRSEKAISETQKNMVAIVLALPTMFWQIMKMQKKA